jgi:hypothetical protein
MPLFGRRLTVHATAMAQLQNAEGGGGATPKGDFDLSNILKLVPADIVSIYLIAKGLAPKSESEFVKSHWLQIAFWLCLAACVLVRIVVNKKAGWSLKSVNWQLVGVTTVAFFIWAHAVGDEAPVFSFFSGSLAGLFALLFGAIAPKLVPAESA